MCHICYFYIHTHATNTHLKYTVLFLQRTRLKLNKCLLDKKKLILHWKWQQEWVEISLFTCCRGSVFVFAVIYSSLFQLLLDWLILWMHINTGRSYSIGWSNGWFCRKRGNNLMIFRCAVRYTVLTWTMGDDVAITTSVRSRIKDLIAAALFTTVVLVNAVHESEWKCELTCMNCKITAKWTLRLTKIIHIPVGVLATTDKLLIVIAWSEFSHALVTRVKATVMSVMGLTPAVFGISGRGGQFWSEGLITLANIALAWADCVF